MNKLMTAALSAVLLLPAASFLRADDVPAKPAAAEIAGAAAPNTLTEQEKADGWKLLFDGKSLNGWHNFKKTDVRPGWQVKDGALVCVDPKNAGDIVTADKYDWFELSLDYNISEGGNSGIMFHVTDDGGAVWADRPGVPARGQPARPRPPALRLALPALQARIDPKTGKPARRHQARRRVEPRRAWSSRPEKCEHDVNGVKYFEYVLGSDDFKAARRPRASSARCRTSPSPTPASSPCRATTARSPSATSSPPDREKVKTFTPAPDPTHTDDLTSVCVVLRLDRTGGVWHISV